MNAREKGKRGERQWRDELRAQGYQARRGQQFAGSPDSPDVVCAELDWIHFEVKAVERLNIEDAMDQARRDAGAVGEANHLTPALSRSRPLARPDGPSTGRIPSVTSQPPEVSPRGGEGVIPATRKVPVVAHKRRHRRWLVTMEAETFFQLLRGEMAPSSGDEGRRLRVEGQAAREDVRPTTVTT